MRERGPTAMETGDAAAGGRVFQVPCESVLGSLWHRKGLEDADDQILNGMSERRPAEVHTIVDRDLGQMRCDQKTRWSRESA